MGVTVKIQAMALDGIPLGCPECDTSPCTLEGRGPIDAFASVWATCGNYHSWEHQLITMSDLEAIQATSTGRERAEDDDTFVIEIGGATLAGVLHPDVILDDLKRAARDVYWKRMLKPAIRRRKNAAKRAVKRPIRSAKAAVAGAASDSVAATKAAAIGAAWDWQTAGGDPDPDYTPEPVNPCAACKGRGHHNIKSRLHDTTKVPCLVCSGTGEID